MKFSRVSKSVTVITSDDGEALTFSTSVYERTKLEKNENVYDETNRYLQTLDKEQLKNIMDVYRRIHAEIARMTQFEELAENMTRLVTELYNQIDIGDVERWVFGFNKIEYPSAVSTTVTADLNPAKTYVRADYDALVVLTIALRFMLPVWGAYQESILPIVRGKFKEHIAAKLLTKTSLINHRSIRRLQVFIETQITPNAKKESAILSGLGTEELPDWLLGGALVKRLAVADIHDEGGLIRNVYGFVNNYLTEISLFWGILKAKNTGDGDGDGNDFSIVEHYRGKKLRSDGDLAAGKVYVTQDSGRGETYVFSDHLRLARHIDPTIPEHFVRACYDNAMSSPIQSEVQNWQVILAQYIFYRKAMTPNSIAALNKTELVNIVLVVAQAIYFYYGFIQLGLLIKAEPVYAVNNNQMLQLPSMSRITAKTMEPLEATFPNKLNGTKASTNIRQANVAYVGINELATMMNKSHWNMNYGIPLENLLGQLQYTNPGPVVENIQEVLALLAIRLNHKGDTQ